MEENSFEKMFGKNALEKMLQVQIDEFATDDETKVLFNELCDLITASDLKDKDIIDLIIELPYNMGYSVLAKSRVDNRGLITEYREKLFQEFLGDAKDISSKGVSKFERRFLTQPSNIERVLQTRILTRYELEFLFNKVSKYTHLKDLSYKESKSENNVQELENIMSDFRSELDGIKSLFLK